MGFKSEMTGVLNDIINYFIPPCISVPIGAYRILREFLSDIINDPSLSNHQSNTTIQECPLLYLQRAALHDLKNNNIFGYTRILVCYENSGLSEGLVSAFKMNETLPSMKSRFRYKLSNINGFHKTVLHFDGWVDFRESA